MKKMLLLFVIICIVKTSAVAQYVTIPDTSFRKILLGNYPSCFNAAQRMDTTCPAILTATSVPPIQGLDYYTVRNLEGIQYFKSLDTLDWSFGIVNHIPSFPATLEVINFQGDSLTSIPPLPNGLLSLGVDQNQLVSLPSLPVTLTYLSCYNNLLTSLPALPPLLDYLDCSINLLTSLPAIPTSLQHLECSNNHLTSLPPFTQSSMFAIGCESNNITSLPQMPQSLQYFSCGNNPITSLSALSYFEDLGCDGTLITSLPPLPAGLRSLSCSYTNLTFLPPLPASLVYLYCNYLNITSLPPLPSMLTVVSCEHCHLTSLPPLPASLSRLVAYSNNIYCLPVLPVGLGSIQFDFDKIPCIPNSGASLIIYDTNRNVINNYPVCNATNNANGCMAFPVVQGNMFYDLNSNGVKDAGEYNKRYGRVNLSNGATTFTDNSGVYQLAANTIGAFTVTAVPPLFFNAVPASKSYNFSTYDTTVTQNIALQPSVSHDSLRVTITPFFNRARPGFVFSYNVSYQNAGSTNLPASTVKVHYNNSQLTFNSSSNATVTNAGNTLTLSLPSLPVGTFGDYAINFTVNATAPLGNTLTTDAIIAGGAISNVDTARNTISGSFDPNDKSATPTLTTQQIGGGAYIDYVVRFQNTGTDTAFHVVITDTLSNQLQANTLELISTSHSCKATVKGKAVTFEMRNIMLPDHIVNEAASHGFIRFRVKPVNTLIPGNIVNNKAAIYFDYNSPVVTNTAITQIVAQVVPLKLISFKGHRLADNNINLCWYTNNEMNTKAFAIEQSANTTEFSEVAEVRARGYGDNNYSYNIPATQNGNLFFRLKMVDKDGAFSYSPVILIKGINQAGFILQENPVQDELVLTSIAPSLLHTQGLLVNTLGTVVKRFTINSTTQTIEVNKLHAGVYYLKTIQGNAKVIISR